MPSSSPAIGESPGAAAAPKPASINRETVSAGDQCFGERATTLESAGGLERVGLEGAGMMEGAAGLESASNLEDLSSSLSSRDLSGAGPIESAGLEKEIPLQERSLSFARRLQGFLRKSE